MSDIETNCVELEEYNDDAFVYEFSKNIQYPCLEIEPITSQEEFSFFQAHSKEDANALPLYCKVEGVLCKIGFFSLTLDNLLMLRSIFDYRLILHKTESDSVDISLNEPESLVRFIKL